MRLPESGWFAGDGSRQNYRGIWPSVKPLNIVAINDGAVISELFCLVSLA
jgi:hypothetical protein